MKTLLTKYFHGFLKILTFCSCFSIYIQRLLQAGSTKVVFTKAAEKKWVTHTKPQNLEGNLFFQT